MSRYKGIGEDRYSNSGGLDISYYDELARRASDEISNEIWLKHKANYAFPYGEIRDYVEHLKFKQRSQFSWQAYKSEVVIYFVNQYSHAVYESQGQMTLDPDSIYRRNSPITMQGKIKKKRQVHGTNFRMSAIE